MLSDIQIAKRITEASEASDSTFVRGKWNILPWPPVAFLATEPLFVYFEIYNLTRDEFGATRYEIAYEVQTRADAAGSILSTILPGIRKKTGETIEVRFEQTGTEPSVYDYVELDIAGAKTRTLHPPDERQRPQQRTDDQREKQVQNRRTPQVNCGMRIGDCGRPSTEFPSG